MADILDELEQYAKKVMPSYPNDLCSRAKAEITRLRAGIDIARVGLLRIERMSEEARALVTASMRTINGKPETLTSGKLGDG